MRLILSKRIISLLLILTGMLLSFGGIGYAYVMRGTSNPGAAPLPREVAGKQASRMSIGWQAAGEVSRLHGKGFPLNTAGVGDYGSDRSITIWATGAPLKVMAGRMVIRMQDKISEGNSPFTPLGERRHAGRNIYELEGMGQKHFYFQSSNLVVWLAVNADLAEQALSETLEFYP
jgi:hypothetical protein